MFFSGLVFGCSSGSGVGLGSSLVGDLIGDDCGDCACVNVFMRCAITELRTGFSGVLLFVLWRITLNIYMEIRINLVLYPF